MDPRVEALNMYSRDVFLLPQNDRQKLRGKSDSCMKNNPGGDGDWNPGRWKKEQGAA